MATDEQRAKECSDMFAASWENQYIPSEAGGLGVTRDRYTQSYLRAFVDGPRVHRSGENDALRDWFVVVKKCKGPTKYDGGY